MKQLFKVSGMALFALVVIVVLYLGYVLFWSVKYKAGECITNGATVYLIDSGAPMIQGVYVVAKLPQKSGDSDIAMPRVDIENEDWQRVNCPKN